MIRTRQVQSAPEVLVILTHSRIRAGAASALGVGERRAAHRLHSHLPAYSAVGDKSTQQAVRQSCQVAGKIPQCWTSHPVAGGGAGRGLGGCKRHVLVGLSSRGRRATRACGPGQSRLETASRGLPCVSGSSAFQFSSTPRGHLGRNGFPPTPLAESGWGGKRDGGAPRGPSLGPERGPS